MRTIPVGLLHQAIVDDDDFEHVRQYHWHVHKTKNIIYARADVYSNGERTKVYMHRLLTHPKDCEVVDHADCNGLNNTRSNLRVCGQSQNTAASRLSATNKTGYKGVSFDKQTSKYVAKIGVNYRSVNLGLFVSPRLAAIAYDSAAEKHFGQFSRTNKSIGLL